MKKKKLFIYSILIFAALLLISFTSFSTEQKKEKNKSNKFKLSSEFRSTWFDGKAEISSYKLIKSRYGEMREGNAVLVFVTEPFLMNTQVKYEGHKTDEERATVLKLNKHETFTTGIYPYSIFTSVFNQLNPNLNAVKVNTTVQEWCGHTFLQLNRSSDKYKVKSYSYFQKEADTFYEINNVLTEDEIFTKIRISPDNLPIGQIKLIPKTAAARLNHFTLSEQPAKAELQKDKDFSIYKVVYSDIERSIRIKFENKSPFKILEWEESYLDFGKLATSKAELVESIRLDYWNTKNNADSKYRELLGLQ